MRLLLVRHGQSEWNASHRLQGQADIALSDEGRRQADALRPTIAAIEPCRAISSDLDRVKETARRIGARDAEFTDRLRENHVGEWTGRTMEEIQTDDREAYLAWRAGNHTPTGGESWNAFAVRVSGVIEEEAANPCENLLVVCHGGVIRALLQHFLGLQPANVIPVAPASLTALQLASRNGKPARLELFNYRPAQLEFDAPD